MGLIPANASLRLLGVWHYVQQAATRRYGNARRLKGERSRFYQAIWSRAAKTLGLDVVELDDGLWEIAGAQGATRFWQNYTTLDDAVTLRLAGNKPAVLRRLNEMKVPTPAWTTFTLDDLTPAKAFLQGRTCVVKPARNTGAGSGVTTGVRTAAELARAAAVASAHDSLLLMEEQISGDNYRLLFLDGALIETVRRFPPSVCGDGRSSIKQLIAAENRQRIVSGWRRAQTLLSIDADMRQTLSQAGLSLRTRPAAGQTVQVKTVINENQAGENQLIESLAPEIVAQCRQAAECVGARLAGVDIVTGDLHCSLAEVGGVVLEVNTTPGLYHHYDPRRDVCRVATQILAASLAEVARRAELQQQVMEHAK